MTPKQVFEKYADSVVKINADDSQGTGFFVSSGNLVATCYHVIRGAQHIEVKTSDNHVWKVTQVAFNEDKDAALLVVEGNTRHEPIPTGAYDKMSPGDELSIIGNPLGFLTQSLTTGIVSARRKIDGVNLLQMTAAISPGSSGSPVFNSSGEVVGFVSFHYADGEALNLAVAIDELQAVMRTRSISMEEFAKAEASKSKDKSKDSQDDSDKKYEPEEFSVAAASEVLREWHHDMLSSLNAWESWLLPYYYSETAKSSDQKVIADKLADLFESINLGLELNDIVKDLWKPEEVNSLKPLISKFEDDAVAWASTQDAVNTILVTQPHRHSQALDAKLSNVANGYWKLINDLVDILNFVGDRDWVSKAGYKIDVTDPLVVYYHVCRLNACVSGADQKRCLISASFPVNGYPGGPGVVVALRRKGAKTWNNVATWVDFEKLVLTWPRSTAVEIRVKANGKAYVVDDQVVSFVAKK